MRIVNLLFGPDGWGGLLLQGAWITVLLSLCTIPIGFGAGLGLAGLKRSGLAPVRWAADSYTTFFRGIPDLLSLFIVYFGLQAVLDKLGGMLGVTIELSAFLAGVIALSVVAAAYSSEIWVAALQSVARGQIEAAASLGLDRRRIFRFVTLPQLLRVAVPGLGNVWMVMIKDTSLISTLAVVDLLRAASEASKNTREPLVFYSVAALIYLLFSIASAAAQFHLERRVNRGYA